MKNIIGPILQAILCSDNPLTKVFWRVEFSQNICQGGDKWVFQMPGEKMFLGRIENLPFQKVMILLHSVNIWFYHWFYFCNNIKLNELVHYPYVCLAISPSLCLLSICLSIPTICLCIYLFVCVSICNWHLGLVYYLFSVFFA